MENKTEKNELLKISAREFIATIDKSIGEGWSNDVESLSNAIAGFAEEYASLQCAEMKEEIEALRWFKGLKEEESNRLQDENDSLKEENERLKERIEGYEFGEQFKDSPFTSTSHLIKEVSELQEEVERFKSELRMVYDRERKTYHPSMISPYPFPDFEQWRKEIR